MVKDDSRDTILTKFFFIFGMVFVGMMIGILLSNAVGNDTVKSFVLDDVCKELTSDDNAFFVDSELGVETSFHCDILDIVDVVDDSTVVYPKSGLDGRSVKMIFNDTKINPAKIQPPSCSVTVIRSDGENVRFREPTKSNGDCDIVLYGAYPQHVDDYFTVRAT